MIKVTLAPGEELAMHSHPVWMVYVLKSGQLTGENLKAGDSFQGPHVSHRLNPLPPTFRSPSTRPYQINSGQFWGALLIKTRARFQTIIYHNKTLYNSVYGGHYDPTNYGQVKV